MCKKWYNLQWLFRMTAYQEKLILERKIHRLFNKFRFKLDIQTNLKIMGYLDVTLNLYYFTVSPLRKHNQCQYYINNHSRHVFKHIPDGIMVRLSTYSSNVDIFKHEYKVVLKNCGYKAKLVYTSIDEAAVVFFINY